MCGIHVFLWRNKEVFDLTWHKSTEAKITVPTTNRWKAKLTLTNPSLTRPRSRNKCRRKEKCKMAALIRQANSGYELANKPHKKEKKKTYGGREEREDKQQQQTNTFGKERDGRKYQRATGQRLDTRNPCTRYNPLSSDNSTAGQQTITNYTRQRKIERSR